MRISLIALTAGCLNLLAACSDIYYDVTGPARPIGFSEAATANPAMRCASERLFFDALNGDQILTAENGFYRRSTREEIQPLYDYVYASNRHRGLDCSSTFAASRQQFANFLDASYFLVPPTYPAAQNPQKVRPREGDPVASSHYLRSSSAPRNSSDSLRQAEILMNAGSALMNGGAPTSSSGGTCYLQSDRISGFNKLCEYSCVSGNTVRTIASTQICPLTTTN